MSAVLAAESGKAVSQYEQSAVTQLRKGKCKVKSAVSWRSPGTAESTGNLTALRYFLQAEIAGDRSRADVDSHAGIRGG